MANDKEKKSLFSGLLSYSGRGDRERKNYIDSLTDEPAKPSQTSTEEPTPQDHKRGYTQEKWD